jgi:phosphate starvation-inducible membrane PsiE
MKLSTSIMLVFGILATVGFVLDDHTTRGWRLFYAVAVVLITIAFCLTEVKG